MMDLLKLLNEVVAQDELAWLTLKKNFVDKVFSVDEQRQVHLYLAKVSFQHSHAIYIRAWLYEYGYGVAQDIEMAFILMREAAGLGDKYAMFEVGKRFYYGIGIEKNLENALQWFSAAAVSPHYHPAAMYYLGMLYDEGAGIPIDKIKAQQWFEKAKAKGYQFQ